MSREIEYHEVIFNAPPSVDDLNKFGEDRWEVCGMVTIGAQPVEEGQPRQYLLKTYFRREKSMIDIPKKGTTFDQVSGKGFGSVS